MDSQTQLKLDSEFIEHCKNGDLELVNCTIAKGATAWTAGLRAAACQGHLQIVKLILKKNSYNRMFSCILESIAIVQAYTNGHLHLVRYLFKTGIYSNINHCHILEFMYEDPEFVPCTHLNLELYPEFVPCTPLSFKDYLKRKNYILKLLKKKVYDHIPIF